MHTAGPKQGDRNAQNHYHNDRCWTRCDDLDPAIFCGPYSRHRCKLGRHHWQRVQPRQRSRQYRSRRQQRPEPLRQQLHRVSAGGDWCRRICQTPALVAHVPNRDDHYSLPIDGNSNGLLNTHLKVTPRHLDATGYWHVLNKIIPSHRFCTQLPKHPVSKNHRGNGGHRAKA